MRKTRFRVTMSVVQSHTWKWQGEVLSPLTVTVQSPRWFHPGPKLDFSSHCLTTKPLGLLIVSPGVDTGPLHMLYVRCPSSPFLLCLATSCLSFLDITCPSGKTVTLSAFGFRYIPFMPQAQSPRGSVRTSICKSGFLLDCQCIQDEVCASIIFMSSVQERCWVNVFWTKIPNIFLGWQESPPFPTTPAYRDALHFPGTCRLDAFG